MVAIYFYEIKMDIIWKNMGILDFVNIKCRITIPFIWDRPVLCIRSLLVGIKPRTLGLQWDIILSKNWWISPNSPNVSIQGHFVVLTTTYKKVFANTSLLQNWRSFFMLLTNKITSFFLFAFKEKIQYYYLMTRRAVNLEKAFQ